MTSQAARDKILADIIKRITEEEEYKRHEVTKKEKACNGSNYTAAIYYITVKDEDKGILELFAKVAKANHEERNALSLEEMYSREIFVYYELVDIYTQLHIKHQVPLTSRFRFPKSYGANSNAMEETVVLENLSSQGFSTPDRFAPIDWDFASKSVSELAKFHALSYAFERDDPKSYRNIVNTKREFLYTKINHGTNSKYTKDRLNAAIDSLTLENAARFKDFLDTLDDVSAGFQEQFKCQSHPCLVHGDYKHSNLMIRKKKEKIVELVPVDYQMLHHGSPINDLLYFIFTGSDETFRHRHYEQLIEHYYRALVDNLARFSLEAEDVYPRADFNADLKDRTVYGIYLGIFVLPYMLAESKPEFTSNADDITIKNDIHFKVRFNGIINSFVKWGFL